MPLKRGRPPNAIPTIDWKIHVPITIAAKVDLLCLDPVTMRAKHGARSQLVTNLLITWLRTQGIALEPVAVPPSAGQTGENNA